MNAFRPATRQGIRPLIGLYGESGTGKTMSALLLARGFAGPQGRIAMVDTESGRGSLYADVIPGGYDTLQLGEPFAPAAYIDAIRGAESEGYAILVIDSASHEWEGLGGVLDMASQIEAKSGKSLNVWRQPKMEHAKFVLKLLQCSLPVIVCLRAKYKTRQGKEGGKTVIVKDDYTTPIQADDFIFEMTAHGEIMPDHSLRLTKHSHPSLKQCFPEQGPVTMQHGQELRLWCQAAGTPASAKASKRTAEENDLLQRVWVRFQGVHGGKNTPENVARVDAELVRLALIGDGEKFTRLPVEALRSLAAQLEAMP